MAALDRSEYIEQQHLWQMLRRRGAEQLPMQDLLQQVRYELLATTRLPMAVDYLLTELRHSGLMGPAMQKLSHYFTPFQSFLIDQAEREAGRFTMSAALQILEGEAEFRVGDVSPQGMFFFHFESICRNRLPYDRGLTASSADPVFDRRWTKWLLKLRGEIGLVDLADLLFLASDHYAEKLRSAGQPIQDKGPFLFGVKEGTIAFGNRGRDPLFLFAAMQRHLGYPKVPRIKPPQENKDLIPQMARRIERLESRIQLLEAERKGGIDLTKFYEKHRPDGLPKSDGP